MKRWFSLSSNQSISLPMMFNSALLSIKILTPSCSTCSSSIDGLSTYSRSYASPEHPFAFVPIRMSFGSGWLSNSRRCATADCESFTGALRGPKLYRRGRRGLVGAAWLFCASPSGTLTFGCSCCVGWLRCSGANREGVHDFASVAPPAIEVSGTPALRGGGGGGCSDDGW
jgi:hypothetical protein